MRSDRDFAWAVVGWGLFVLGAIYTLTVKLDYWQSQRQLEEYRAKVATGPCGDKELVVLQEQSFIVAGGEIMPVEHLPRLKFEGGVDGALTVKKDGYAIMVRPPTEVFELERQTAKQ